MTTIPDLWPELTADSAIAAPESILRTQAELLSEKTRGLVVGEVQSERFGGGLLHSLFLRVPALEDYSTILLQIKQPLDLYPLRLISLHDMRNPFVHFNPSKAPRIDSYFGSEGLMCTDEAAYIAGLRALLGSESTKRVLATLMAQAAAPPDED